MSEKVLCPYCGAEMKDYLTSATGSHKAWLKTFMCTKCRALSPCCDTREEARSAALRRYTPPLRPMTLEDIKAAYEGSEVIGCPFIVEERRVNCLHWAVIDMFVDKGIVAVWNANNDCNFEEHDYGKTWRCWERKPTETEMREAAWEK